MIWQKKSRRHYGPRMKYALDKPFGGIEEMFCVKHN